MDEIGTDISDHVPRGLDDLHDLSFDRIITLSPEAQHKALALAHGYAIEVDYWPAPDPTLATGAREQISVPTATFATVSSPKSRRNLPRLAQAASRPSAVSRDSFACVVERLGARTVFPVPR